MPGADNSEVLRNDISLCLCTYISLCFTPCACFVFCMLLISCCFCLCSLNIHAKSAAGHIACMMPLQTP